jgi:hypothetical protein
MRAGTSGDTDIDRAVTFYRDLVDMQPIVRRPRYVPFDLGNQITLARWNAHADRVATNPARTSEIALQLPPHRFECR